MEISTHTLEQTKQFAAEVVGRLAPGDKGAMILALHGDLGAGKTAFAQGVAAALGVTELVASPTFVIEKIYDLPASAAFRRLTHIDAYRLAGGDDLAKLGFADICADPANLIVLEWPERVADILPEGVIPIHFTFMSEAVRKINYGS